MSKAECLSLSLRESLWHFPPTLETAHFNLRRLRLDLGVTEPFGEPDGWGSGVEQFLTTQRLPCLRELRLSCRRLPKISTDFINQLYIAQIDFLGARDVEDILGGVRQIGPFSAPVLFSFDVGSFYPYRGPGVQGIAFVHLRTRGT